MAIRTPLWLQAGSYNAELDRLLMLMFLAPANAAAGTLSIRSGVLSGLGNMFAVGQTSTASMQLQVFSGVAMIQGTQSTTQGAYALINDATTNVTVTAANATNPRIDLLILEVLDASYSGSSSLGQLRVVPGTPAASPVVPTLPANSIPLARIAVAANAASISNANITDLRPFNGGRGGFHWGSGTTFPTAGVLIFDTYAHAGMQSLMRWNGAAWRQVEMAEVANVAARNAISTNNSLYLHPGFRVREADTGRIVFWDGARWLKSLDSFVEQIYANGNTGGSGSIGTGGSPVVLGVTVTSPVATLRARVEASVAVQSTSSNIGTIRVTLGTIVQDKIFNVGTTAESYAMTFPTFLFAGDNTYSIQLFNNSGTGDIFMAHSSLAVYI